MATEPTAQAPTVSVRTPSTTSNPPPPTQRTLRIGTRSSALALAQVDLFTSLLRTAHKDLISTTHPSHTNPGDTNKTTDLHTLASGGKSLWTEDLEIELRENRVDIIVHSMKDVPTQLPKGFVCAAVGAREEPRDAVVMSRRRAEQGLRTLGDLPEGSAVGTSSVRRAAMIRRTYPGLRIENVRGNVPTRIRKVDDEGLGFDALVLAGAGVQRLGMDGRVSSWLGRGEGVLHAVGQGALGVEWREGDEWVEGLLEGIGREMGARRVGWEVMGERNLLRALEGGCSVPVGVDCLWDDDAEDSSVTGELHASNKTRIDPPTHETPSADNAIPSRPNTTTHRGGCLTMRAMVVSLDGTECVESCQSQRVRNDRDAEDLSFRVYKDLVDKGAEEILKKIRLNRGMIEGQDGA